MNKQQIIDELNKFTDDPLEEIFVLCDGELREIHDIGPDTTNFHPENMGVLDGLQAAMKLSTIIDCDNKVTQEI